MTPRLDIIIPVYNEGNIILATLAALRRQVTTPSRILVCYDTAGRRHPFDHQGQSRRLQGLAIEFVRTPGVAPTAR